MPVSMFLDTEFTGLHQKTRLISIALVEEGGAEFYAELTDYRTNETMAWLERNPDTMRFLEQEVYSKLWFTEEAEGMTEQRGHTFCVKGDSAFVRNACAGWLNQYESVEIWADVPAYDWVLFCELFGGAFGIPDNIFYAPFDLATLFRKKGFIQPQGKYHGDVKRFEFAGVNASMQHHALEDARVEKMCFDKLQKDI